MKQLIYPLVQNKVFPYDAMDSRNHHHRLNHFYLSLSKYDKNPFWENQFVVAFLHWNFVIPFIPTVEYV